MLQDNVPVGGCSQHDDCDLGGSCVSYVCNAGHCSHYFLQEDCCANFVCDDDEDIATCSDCELSTLSTTACTDCTSPKGVMFDLTSNRDIIINSLTIQLYNGTNNIVVYTGLAYGNYSNKATDPNQWTPIYTNTFVQLGEYFS
jgi:hypothetical protein